MFIAMNRFIINEGHEEAFENVWRNRDSSLSEVPGFKTFHLLKGPRNDTTGQTLYASHTDRVPPNGVAGAVAIGVFR
jgi:heme-degrading monooxygenase HmoA